MEELLAQRKENLGQYPEKLLGDTAYGGAQTRQAMLDKQINLIAKVPPASNKNNFFSKEEFNIDLNARLITCPAGQTVSIVPKRETKKQIERANQGIVKFPKDTCDACPLKGQCTKSKSGRTIRIHDQEALLQAARTQQKTPEFKAEYSARANVERAIAHLTRHGARQTHLVGVAWNNFKLAIHGAVKNIMVMAKYAKETTVQPVTG